MATSLTWVIITPVSLKELADILVNLNGGGSYTVHTFPAARKKIDIGDYYSDFSKYENAVGWVPKVGLREGLKKSLEYFRANLSYYI